MWSNQQPGYQQPGYQQPGYQQPGYQSQGYQPQGYQPQGYQPQGYQPQGDIPVQPVPTKSKTLLIVFLVIVVIAAIVLVGYFVIYPLISQSQSAAIPITPSKFTVGGRNWKYTDDPSDSDCLKNWDYVKADGTLLEGSIDNITKTNSSKSWCATKNSIHQASQDKWKYTDDPNDPQCLNNWDYYKNDRKTSLLKNIANITMFGATKTWCSTK